MIVEILIILALTLVNGFLAMSELAIVSSRPVRLRLMMDQGRRGARTALMLQEHPGRFLSAVQIGITLVGVLSGAFSGATLGTRMTAWLVQSGVSQSIAETAGVGLVVAAITYLSLIVGELVPKQIALSAPEDVAVRVARPLRLLAALTTPLVWVLDLSGRAALALLGKTRPSGTEITGEEVRLTLADAESAGVLSRDANEMIAGVMRVADRSARALMTPRTEVEVIDLARGVAAAQRQARDTGRARLPVIDGSPDEVIGVLPIRDLLLRKPSADELRAMIRLVPMVIDRADAAQVIEQLRESPMNMVLVVDEYGHFEGVITPMDVLEGIAGSFDGPDGDGPDLYEREDGSFLVAGAMPADEFAGHFGLTLPEGREFETVAGLVIDRLRHLPHLGETLKIDPVEIEIVDLDGFRIDKILVRRRLIAAVD